MSAKLIDQANSIRTALRCFSRQMRRQDIQTLESAIRTLDRLQAFRSRLCGLSGGDNDADCDRLADELLDIIALND